jgi:hypothetical protein
VTRILARYPELESRASRSGRLCVYDIERWRHVRPLAVAYVLAHAHAARSIIDAFAGEFPPIPPIQSYDPRYP